MRAAGPSAGWRRPSSSGGGRSSSSSGQPRCRAAKGFGGAPASKRTKGAQQAAQEALAEAARSRPKVRPINPKEAARGRVDHVQIKDWAGGRAADISELQVVPGSLNTAFSTAGGRSGGDSSSSSSGGSSSDTAAAAAGPFFKQLGLHAQYLESQGAASVAPGRGAKPYRAFEAWRYSLPRYRQYVAELAAVHEALEAALRLTLSAAAAPPPPGASASSSEIASASSSSNGDTASASSSASSSSEASSLAAYEALACFGEASGLWRGAAAQADAAALSRHAEQQAQQQQQQQRGASASQNAVAYGRYLLQLGRAAAAAAPTAGGSTSSAASSVSPPAGAAEQGEGAAAALQLLAHTYALHTQQQCLGTRIGAAATQALALPGLGAAALYVAYPPHVGEPVDALVRATDAAGERLTPEQRQAVMAELPKALRKSGLLLAPLASA